MLQEKDEAAKLQMTGFFATKERADIPFENLLTTRSHHALADYLSYLLQKGILAGYPIINVRVAVYDGSYHEVDSSEIAFKVAAYQAFKDAFLKASPQILEPIMDVEVTSPDDYIGDVIGDLSSRRGRIEGQDQRMGATIIKVKVPLSEMFGYSTTLRSMSQGRASYAMSFSQYEKIPDALAQEIIKQRVGEGKVRAVDVD